MKTFTLTIMDDLEEFIEEEEGEMVEDILDTIGSSIKQTERKQYEYMDTSNSRQSRR